MIDWDNLIGRISRDGPNPGDSVLRHSHTPWKTCLFLKSPICQTNARQSLAAHTSRHCPLYCVTLHGIYLNHARYAPRAFWYSQNLSNLHKSLRRKKKRFGPDTSCALGIAPSRARGSRRTSPTPRGTTAVPWISAILCVTTQPQILPMSIRLVEALNNPRGTSNVVVDP